MNTTINVYSTEIEGNRLQVQSQHGELMVIVNDGDPITRAADLLQVVPALRQPAYLTVWCRLVTYLAADTMFRVIDHPEAFKPNYLRRAQQVTNPETVLRNHGPFAVDTVAPPALVDGEPVFFAVQSLSGTPFRVRAPFPRDGEAAPLVFEPLPGLTSESTRETPVSHD